MMIVNFKRLLHYAIARMKKMCNNQNLQLFVLKDNS